MYAPGSPSTEQEDSQVSSLNAKHSKVHEDQQVQVPPPVATQEEVQVSVPKATQTGVQVEVQPHDVAASVKARGRHRIVAAVAAMAEEEIIGVKRGGGLLVVCGCGVGSVFRFCREQGR